MKNKNIKVALIVLAAFLSIIGLYLPINHLDVDLIPAISGNSFPAVIIFVLLIYFYYINLNNKVEKKIKIVSIILAIAIAVAQILGISLNDFDGLIVFSYSKLNLLKCLLKLTSLIILFYHFFIFSFSKLKKINIDQDKKKSLLFSANMKSFLIIMGIILICWIPYYLAYFPSIMTPDSFHQFCQALGDCQITNHHPVFHTLIIKISLIIGKLFGGENLAGIITYSIIQMLVMSSIFSFSVYYLNKKNINNKIKIIVLAFYALYPINAIYSFTMWKDILFGGMMLLFTICFIEMTTNTKEFFSKKTNLLILFIISLLVILFRNNGIYIILLTFPFLLLFLKKYWKKTLILFISLIVVNYIYTGPIFNLIGIEQGSIVEALSVPLQQLARVEKTKRAELTIEQKTFLNNLFIVDNIGDYYNPRLSDDVKWKAKDDYIKNNKTEFIRSWLNVGLKYPHIYIQSFVNNNFGYWYPEVIYWTAATDIYDENYYNISPNSLAPSLKKVMNENNIFNIRGVPVISILYSIGGMFTLLMFLFCLNIVKNSHLFLLSFIPVLALWVTILASPVHAEFRYIYGLFTCLPLLFAFTLQNKELKKSEIKQVKK